MNTAEKLGLPSWLDWLVSHDFWTTFVIATAVFYVGHYGIGLIFESRLLPIWDGQFKSFFPGDIGLSFAFGAIVAAARQLPDQGWWLNDWWRGGVLIATLSAALLLMFVIQKPEPADRYLAYYLSPTRLYHGLLLIGGFGYVIIAIGIPALIWMVTHFTSGWLILLALVAGIGFWGWLLVWDFILHPPVMNPERPIHAPFNMSWVRSLFQWLTQAAGSQK